MHNKITLGLTGIACLSLLACNARQTTVSIPATPIEAPPVVVETTTEQHLKRLASAIPHLQFLLTTGSKVVLLMGLKMAKSMSWNFGRHGAALAFHQCHTLVVFKKSTVIA